MEVIILAGGLGTRLRSVVADVPKCMAPVAGKPFLWYLLKYLTKYDVTRVILSVGYLREVIIDWIDKCGDEFPFSIEYAVETEPLGTGGGIKLALEIAKGSNVAVLNGDTFFDVDLNALYEDHRLYPSTVSIALRPMKDFDRYGRVVLDEVQHTVKSFEEKKYCKEGLINGGIYMIYRDTKLFAGLPGKFSFETEVLEPLSAQERVCGFIHNGYFIDIGIPEDYEKANRELPQLFKSRNYGIAGD